MCIISLMKGESVSCFYIKSNYWNGKLKCLKNVWVL